MATATWLTGWTRQCELTVAAGKITGTLTNKDLLVAGVNMPAGFWSGADAAAFEDLRDLRFTLVDGTLLSHALPKGSRASSLLQAHVNVPSAAVGAAVYAQWGNAAASMPTAAAQQAAWNANHKGVWLAEEASGDLADSTANANTLAVTGSPTYAQAAQVGNGISLPGSTGTYFSRNSAPVSTYPLTFACWYKPAALGRQYLFNLKGNDGGWYHRFACIISDNAQTNKVNFNATGWALNTNCVSPLTLSVGTLYRIVCVGVSATERYCYVNGGNVGSGTTSVTPTGVDRMYLGVDLEGSFYYPVNGLMDQVEMMNVAWSAEMVAADYNCQSAPGTFWTTGAIAAAASGSIVGQRVMIPRMSLGRLIG